MLHLQLVNNVDSTDLKCKLLKPILLYIFFLSVDISKEPMAPTKTLTEHDDDYWDARHMFPIQQTSFPQQNIFCQGFYENVTTWGANGLQKGNILFNGKMEARHCFSSKTPESLF